MDKQLIKILYVFLGIVAWLSTMALFIMPMLSPFKGAIVKQNNVPDWLFITLLLIITIAYLVVLVLDTKYSKAAQYFQFVLGVVVFTCSVPFIAAFLIIATVAHISAIQIFVPIIMMLLVLFLHALWFATGIYQNRVNINKR